MNNYDENSIEENLLNKSSKIIERLIGIVIELTGKYELINNELLSTSEDLNK